jgi:alpha-glucosidase
MPLELLSRGKGRVIANGFRQKRSLAMVFTWILITWMAIAALPGTISISLIPKKMIAELAADGFKTVVIIDPGIRVDDNYSVFKEGKENKYFCRRSDDYFMEGHVWPGRCQFPDFTNPEVRDLVGRFV